jgi:tetratricopeptide (TPR) repeat protein
VVDGGDKAHNEVAGAARQPGGVVVSVNSRHHLGRRRLIVLMMVVLLILAAGAIVWWRMSQPKDEPVTYEQVTSEARRESDLWKYDEAAATLEGYLASVPEEKRTSKEYYEAVLSLAKAYFNNKQYDQAIGRYEQLLENDEYKLDAQRGLGKAYAAKGDKARARQYLEAVVATMKTRTDPESQFRITMDEAELNAVLQ